MEAGAIITGIDVAQFALYGLPMLANPDQVTLREADRIGAYFAGGNLCAAPNRLEPLL